MTEKYILLTLTYLVGAGELVLAIFFWVTHSKSEIRKVMALLAFSTGMWVITSAMIAYKSGGNISLLINGFVYTFGILLLTTLIYLTLIFPFPLRRLDWLHKVLLYIPAIIFSVIGFTTRAIEVDYVANQKNAGVVVAGPLLPIYNNFLLFLYVLSIVLLIAQVRRNDGINRQNVKLVLWGVVIGGIPAVIIDLVISTYFPNNVPNFLYGVLSSVIWFGTTTYIVLKK